MSDSEFCLGFIFEDLPNVEFFEGLRDCSWCRSYNNYNSLTPNGEYVCYDCMKSVSALFK